MNFAEDLSKPRKKRFIVCKNLRKQLETIAGRNKTMNRRGGKIESDCTKKAKSKNFALFVQKTIGTTNAMSTEWSIKGELHLCFWFLIYDERG
ncbi:hypothetical protein LOAG_18766 [Loa loa]|uniref:Uncharacterized protein n=1 Tax=Loa loa TaxID=7209 RepID=A0A1S0UDV4_LOALO|nr:hypothetical protein LOAG_18766 [Loa loa]EJD73842.1 hypothetical protein LOAG_18766 [Loa loa]